MVCAQRACCDCSPLIFFPSLRLFGFPPPMIAAGSEFNGSGLGVRANYTCDDPRATPRPPQPALPSPPALTQPTQHRSVAVASVAELLTVASDPSVSLITITSGLSLNGTTVTVQGTGRSLTIQADQNTCGRPSDGPLPGACALHAGGLSRHFKVSSQTGVSLKLFQARRQSHGGGGAQDRQYQSMRASCRSDGPRIHLESSPPPLTTVPRWQGELTCAL